MKQKERLCRIVDVKVKAAREGLYISLCSAKNHTIMFRPLLFVLLVERQCARIVIVPNCRGNMNV